MFSMNWHLGSSRAATGRFLLVLMAVATIAACGTFEVGLEPTRSPESVATTVDVSTEMTPPPTTFDPHRSEAEASPGPGPYEIAISWVGEMKGECQGLHINHGGEAGIGPCKRSFREMVPIEERFEHAGWWQHWLQRFAPFEADTPSGQIVFHGSGQERANPAWQRAMANWAELVWVELETDGQSESWITVLSLKREIPERPGNCKSLQITIYGLARASSAPCTAGEAEVRAEGWLETPEWDRFDVWYYSNIPIANAGLDFYGVGLFEMSEDELVDLHLWGEAVYNRLMLNNLLE